MISTASIPFALTPQLMVQYCTFHLGTVMNVADPEGRGRVQVEVPGLLGTGKENWTDWVEVSGSPIGGANAEGDEGIWWPLQPKQIVLVGFVSGDPFALWCLPGPTVQDGKGRNKQFAPKEAKIAGKKNARDATRVKGFKTESGHTILFDDRGEKEKMAIVDWTGAGMFLVAPGKKKDEEEKEGEESKPRKGERRGTKLVATETAKKPSEILKGSQFWMALHDLIGQGVVGWCTDGGGVWAVYTKKDEEIGPSVYVDSITNCVIVTAGDAQMIWNGEKGHIQVTRQIIKELEQKVEVEKAIEGLKAVGKQAFEEFKE